jgi:hypothetical protein
MTKDEQELNKTHEKLATRILGELDGVLCVKLKELKPELLILRGYFHAKGKNRNILGCKTWAAFCSEKLHHTKQAVNQMLAEPKPSGKKLSTDEPEPPPQDANQESPSPSSEQQERGETVPGCEGPPTPTGKQADSPELDKGRAVAAETRYLSRFQGETLQIKFAEFESELRASLIGEEER